MTIRHALFIDGSWTEVGGDSYTALVTVDEMGIEIKGYIDGFTDKVRFSFRELAAIVELVAAAESAKDKS